MPLPDSPQTREEMYLNGIATGSTDGLPDAPVTREEMYLDYIARNGGGGGGGSSTLSGLTDVDISNPTDGQTLVYNAESGKWENGAGGGANIFVTLGTITAVTVPMSYNEDAGAWVGIINTDIDVPDGWVIVGRDLTVTIGENTYSDEYLKPAGWQSIDGGVGDTQARFRIPEGQPLLLGLQNFDEAEPVITNLSVEVYALTPDLAIFFSSIK